jgi:hypothetical protein
MPADRYHQHPANERCNVCDPMSARTEAPALWTAEGYASFRQRRLNPRGYMKVYVEEANAIVETVEALREALAKAREALRNVPEVGQRFDQQHSDTHMQADLSISDLLAQLEGKP